MRHSKKIITILALLTISSCAWYKENTKDYYFDRTVQLVEWNMPEKLLYDCYNLELERPESIEGIAGGSYDSERKVVFYDPFDMTYLVHEYQHYLNHNGPSGGKVEWRCLDELSAYQARTIHRIAERNMWLERENSVLKRRTKIR